AKHEKSTSGQLMFGLAILAASLVGTWFFVNRWMHKKNLKNPTTSIRVLTQHYIGPKKSLAIVSVAGETILLGVTDHNINMIKSLSLLDDDLPKNLPADFDSTLEQVQGDDRSEGVEDYAMKGVKEIVGERLKNMRSLW